MDLSGYVGIPFEVHGRTRAGCDCWGLLRLVYAEVFNLKLPDYAGLYGSVHDKRIAALVEAEKPLWQQVPRAEARLGDALVFRVTGLPLHVGLHAGEGRFLHVHKGVDACFERLDAPLWSPRLEGVYRPGPYTAVPP